MSLFNTLSVGATGLGAASTSLAIIGDNIANVGTTGFKGSRVTFADMIPEVRGGFVGPTIMGLGARLQTTQTQFGQGTLKDTSNSLDVAVVGRGFFQVRNPDNEIYYTRDGAMHVDKDNFIVNAAGMRIQGFQMHDGEVTSAIGDINLNLNPISHALTTQITVDMVLSADADFSATPFSTATKDGTDSGTTLGDLSVAADFSTSTPVFDSLGVAHDVTLFFERTSGSGWNWSAVIDGGEIDFDNDGDIDGDAGYGFEIADGTFTFDGTGELTGFTQTNTATAWRWIGTDAFTFELNAGLDGSGNVVEGLARMTGGESAVTSLAQDGYRAANLVALRVENDGRIMSSYENGEELVLGKLAIATFPSDDGLQRVGGNLYKETGVSGAVAMGAAGEGGRGDISGFTLENSNVELEDQFVGMIQAQRIYQANTGVVRTANETLQQLVNLV